MLGTFIVLKFCEIEFFTPFNKNTSMLKFSATFIDPDALSVSE
jgi:hypothetical protein